MNHMKVLPVPNSNMIDVFIGEGWEGWSRYRRVMHSTTKKHIYIHIKGNKLNIHQLKEMYTKIK